MHIEKLEIKNILGIAVSSIDPNGNIIELNGDNGSGKTSHLKALMAVLMGKKFIPDDILKQGARDGFIECIIGKGEDELIARLDVEPRKTKLTVSKKDSSPQDVLNSLSMHFGFDPVKGFVNLKGKERKKALLDCIDLGFDLNEHELSRKAIYDKRTEVGRDVTRSEGNLKSLPETPDEVPNEEIDVVALNQRYGEAVEAVNTYQRAQEKRDDLKEKLNNIPSTLNSLHTEEQEIDDWCKEQIERIEKEALSRKKFVEAKKQKLIEEESSLKDYLTKAEQWFNDNREPSDPQKIQIEIVRAEEINKQVRDKEKRNMAISEVNSYTTEYDELTSQLQQHDDKLQTAIENANLPVKGLSIDRDDVLFEGKSLDVLGGAEIIKIATSIAIAKNPTLKVILIDEANILDKKSFKTMADIAEKHDYHIWMTTVHPMSDPEIIFHIEDGKIKE